MNLPATFPETTLCPDPECAALAFVVDRYTPEIAGEPATFLATECAAGHHYTTEEHP